MSKKTSKPVPASPSKSNDSASIAKLSPTLLAIPKERLQIPRTNLQKAATSINQLVRTLTPDRARFDALPRLEFDSSLIDSIVEVARVAIEIDTAVTTVGITSTTAKLSPVLVEQAGAHRTKLLKLLGYHLDGDPEASLQLEDIRKGSGYLNLAEDLIRLGELFHQHEQLIKADTKLYASGDGVVARELANQIHTEIDSNRNPEQRRLNELLTRCWTHLVEGFVDVRAAALFLFRKDAGRVAEWEPSAYALGRDTAARPRKGKTGTNAAKGSSPGGSAPVP